MTPPGTPREVAAVMPAGVLRGPHTVVFGVGQRRVVPELVRASGGGALVITDPQLADNLSLASSSTDSTAGVAVRVFDEAAPELPREQVPQAWPWRAAAARKSSSASAAAVASTLPRSSRSCSPTAARSPTTTAKTRCPDHRSGGRDSDHCGHRVGGDPGRRPH